MLRIPLRRSSPSFVFALAMLLAAPAHAAHTRALALCSDFSTGSLSVANLDTRAVSADVEPIHSDAAARWYGGALHVVNRFLGDNLQVIGPAGGWATALQYSVGNGSNPQDIAFASPVKAWVSRYGANSLLVVNPQTGAEIAPPISLAALADSDGIPEMGRMIRVDGLLFVACQRLTSFTPSNPSVVAVIDAVADTLVDVDPGSPGVQGIALALRNPVTGFVFDPVNARLLLGCAGSYGALDGGVEAIDPVGLVSLGVTIGEAALGGDVSDIALRDASHAYAIVTTANNHLASWDPGTGQVLDTLLTAPGGFSLPDMETNDRGELWVCRNTFGDPGLVVVRTSDDAIVAGPLSTGLPPLAVTFDGETDAVVSAPFPVRPVVGAGARLSAPWPNPVRDRVRFAIELERPASVEADAFDVEGRRVARIGGGRREAGRHEFAWDVAGAGGGRLAAGVYAVRFRVNGVVAGTRRFVVVP